MGQAREGWTTCSEGGVWRKDVGLGDDLATAHGHTQWLGVASVGSLGSRGSYWIGVTSSPEVIKRLKEDLEMQRIETRSRREEVVALARGTQ